MVEMEKGVREKVYFSRICSISHSEIHDIENQVLDKP